MKTIGVRVSEFEQAQLSAHAAKNGSTVSDGVRQIFKEYFAETQKEDAFKKESEAIKAEIKALKVGLNDEINQLGTDIDSIKNSLAVLSEVLKKLMTSLVMQKTGV